VRDLFRRVHRGGRDGEVGVLMQIPQGSYSLFSALTLDGPDESLGMYTSMVGYQRSWLLSGASRGALSQKGRFPSLIYH